MSWGNAGALAGLLALALPVIIHLLGRDPAVRQPFPSLRFIDASRLLPTRWSRIHDPLLLVVRCALLLLAVLALARPHRAREQAPSAGSGKVTRVVVLDSASLAYAVDSAATRGLAQRVLDSASSGMLVITRTPVEAVLGAERWLAREPGSREIVLLSDFARERFPADGRFPTLRSAGFRTIRLLPPQSPLPSRPIADSAGPDRGARVQLIDGGAEGGFATAVGAAIRSRMLAMPDPRAPPVVVVTTTALYRSRWERLGRALRDPRVVALAARLQLGAFALPISDSVVAGVRATPPEGTPLARARSGAVALWAVEDSVDGRPRLVLVSNLPARSPAIVDVMAALTSETALPSAANTVGSLPDSVARSWERAPQALLAQPADATEGSGGLGLARVLWAAVLLVMLLEWWWRGRAEVQARTGGHDVRS